MSELPYSYHTFMLPFIWNDSVNNEGDFKIENFISILSKKYWNEINIDNINSGDVKKYQSDYALYQYLTIPARELVFPSDSRFVYNYEFKHNNEDLILTGNYIIIKGSVKYVLKLNGIKLKIFDIGVAVFIIETEYYGDRRHKDSDKENIVAFDLDDINKINEYGRRINMPFVNNDNSPCFLTADEIIIQYAKEEEPLKDNFSNYDINKLSLTHLLDPIKDIITLGNDEYKLTSNKKKASDKNYYIYPAIDDRMFVCCLVSNEGLSNEIKEKKPDNYLNGWDTRYDETTLANRLYKLFFIEESLSCQDVYMKKELLEESIYQRWSDYGTLYGVTHHSFMCVLNTGVDHVVNAFLTQYVQIAIIVLAQRAGILLLSSKAAAVAAVLEPENEVDDTIFKQIENLQKNYIRTQSQLLLNEITTQEQGVELFGMLTKHLYIRENKDSLDGQMNNLRDVANIAHDRFEREAEKEESKLENLKLESEKKVENLVTIISLFFAIFSVFECMGFIFDPSICRLNKFIGGGIAALIVIILIIYLLYKKHSKKNKKV